MASRGLAEFGATRQPGASGEYAATSSRRGRDILDALATAVVVVDGSGRIEFANARAQAVLKRSALELHGEEVGRVLAPFEVIRRAADSGDGDEGRQKLTLPDSAEVVIGFRVRRLPTDFEVEGESYTVVFQDITQWERLREERDRLMRLAAVSEVLPSVLHELKNPLAAIGAYGST